MELSRLTCSGGLRLWMHITDAPRRHAVAHTDRRRRRAQTYSTDRSTTRRRTTMAASPSRSPSSSTPSMAAAAPTFAGTSSSPRPAVLSAAPAAAARTEAAPTSTSSLLNAAAATTPASFTPAAAPTLTLTTSSCTTETAQGMHLFNINQYSLLKDLGVGKFVRSGTFTVGGHNWAVLFYPSGSEPAAAAGGQHHVSVYLELLTPVSVDVRVMFDLSLVDLRGRIRSLFAEEDAAKGRRRYAVFSTSAGAGGKLLPPHHHPPRCWGVSSFKRSELEAPATYIHDGGLTIRCDMSVIRPPHVSETRPLPPQIDVPPPSLPGDLGKLLEEEDGKDVTVLVQGEAFPAHRAVLAARSPVLKKKILALTPVDDATAPSSPSPSPSPSCTITMDGDMEPAVFKAMLHFIYTDTLPPDTEADDGRSPEFVRRLFVAAEACAVERLKRVCESIMCGNLSQATLNGTMAFAEQHRCDELRAACVKFALASLPPGKISSEFFKRLKRSADAINLEAHKRAKTS